MWGERKRQSQRGSERGQPWGQGQGLSTGRGDREGQGGAWAGEVSLLLLSDHRENKGSHKTVNASPGGCPQSSPVPPSRMVPPCHQTADSPLLERPPPSVMLPFPGVPPHSLPALCLSTLSASRLATCPLRSPHHQFHIPTHSSVCGPAPSQTPAPTQGACLSGGPSPPPRPRDHLKPPQPALDRPPTPATSPHIPVFINSPAILPSPLPASGTV